MRAVRSNMRTSLCEWRSHSSTQLVDVLSFGEPLMPNNPWHSFPAHMSNWTTSGADGPLLDGLFGPASFTNPNSPTPFYRILRIGPHEGMRLANCSIPAPWNWDVRKRTTVTRSTLLFRAFRYTHLYQAPSHGLNTPAEAHAYRQQICACYRVMGDVMSQLKAVQPRLVLDYSAEWPNRGLLEDTETLLASCHITPEQTTFLHFNLGTMLPVEKYFPLETRLPRRREYADWAELETIRTAPKPPAPLKQLRVGQAYFHFYQSDLALPGPRSASHPFPELCNLSSTSLFKRVRALMGQGSFLMLGGRPKLDRGFIMLELFRRGVLQRGRYSALRYDFCDIAEHAGLASRPDLWRGWGPWTPEHNWALLNDPGLRRFCRTLPRVLDVSPDDKAKTDFSVAHDLWQNTSFGVTLDTATPSFDWREQMSFTTEKTMKPIANLRPFVLIGAAGGLAILRSLGFKTFEPLINESYDTIPAEETRVRAAVDEVERLAALSPAHPAWTTVVDVIIHNARHLACGGLARVLQRRAHAVLQSAFDRGYNTSLPPMHDGAV